MEHFNTKLDAFIMYLRNKPYHTEDKQNRVDAFVEKIKEGLIDFPDQFYYIFDVTKGDIVFITPNAEKVLGYPLSQINVRFMWEQVHPEDYQVAFDVISETFKYCYAEDVPALEAFFTINYRLKHAKGHYIRLQRHVMIINKDRNGNMLHYLCACEDISAHKLYGRVEFKISGKGVDKFKFDVSPYYPIVKHYQKRELEILQHLYQGESSLEIAENLCISRNTVDTHRRALLRKSGTKSTPELLAFAQRNGLV